MIGKAEIRGLERSYVTFGKVAPSYDGAANDDQFTPPGEVFTPASPSNTDPTAQAVELSPQQKIHQAATELEQGWAQKLGDKAGTTVVGVLSTDGWIGDRFVYLQELADSIIAAGGTPKLICMSRGQVGEQMEGVQSLLIPGGSDVDPSFYGAEKGPAMATSTTDKAFDQFELDATRLAMAQKMPMLGLCRGEQLMNVAGGGTLVQDIATDKPGSLNHWNQEAFSNRQLRRYGDQTITIKENSRLHKVLGSLSATVNSIHHQCIGALSPQLYVTAWAMDQIPEAVEVKGAPWQVGLQFHPEWLRLDQSKFQGFFDQLVNDGQSFKSGELLRPPAPPSTLTVLC